MRCMFTFFFGQRIHVPDIGIILPSSDSQSITADEGGLSVVGAEQVFASCRESP